VIAFFAVLLGAVVLGTVVLIVAPLRRRATEDHDDHDAADAELLAARQAALQTIRELDFDYQLGNLATDDYYTLRERHKRDAIALLRARPAQAGADAADDPLDAAIEQAVRDLRQRRRDARTVASTGAAPSPGRCCPDCGRLAAPEDRFCAGCGAALAADAPTLGRPAAPPAPRRLPSSRRRAIGWLAGGAAVTLAMLGGVAWLTLAARWAQQDQQPLAQLPSQVQAVQALTFVPGQADAVLAGHRAGLLASADGGRTWRPRAAAGAVTALVASPARPQVVYAAGAGAVLTSVDGGQAWMPLRHDLPDADLRALAVDPEQADVLYAVAGGALIRSDDGGARWRRVGAQAPGAATGLAVASGLRGALYLATADQGVFVSPDGRSWANASGFVNGALPTRRIAALAYDPRSGDSFVMPTGERLAGALYAGTDRGLFKSSDGGGSWTRLPLETDVAALAVNPANSAVLLVVDGRGRVFRSEDRGLTWRGER
jgi:photosystem II stability/assembly factor-like uncharacterized protein